MKRTINEAEFINAFDEMNRSENFTREGRAALFEYFEGYEEETGDEMELDVIAICCEYSEYANMEEFRTDYGDNYENIEDIENRTQVIRIPGGDAFIIQQF